MTMTLDRRAADPLLEWSKIINCDHPAEPAATLRRPCPDRLTKRRIVRRGVIEHAHHLQVMPCSQRQDPVAGAEAGMESAVEEGHAQLRSESLCRSLQAFRAGRARQVIQVHAHIVAGDIWRKAAGPHRRGPAGPRQVGSAGCRMALPRRDSKSSHILTRTSYAGAPISAISSERFSRYTGRTPRWASVLDEQYQSRSAPPGPQPSRPY